MGLKKPDGTDEYYTPIPNRLIRSPNLDVHDKVVYCMIASCGENAFPSYQRLMEWSGLSKDRVWKSLRHLEELNIIRRFKRGVQVFYRTHWNSDLSEEDGFKQVNYSVRHTDSSVRETDQSVRHTDSISPPDGPVSVRHTDPIKIKEKDLLKSGEEIFESQKKPTFSELIESWSGRAAI